jgi:single-strand DNA-binding protein
MSSVNKTFLLGSVGRDPEVKEINGAKYASFTLATNESYKDKNGDRQTITDWHNIVCWRNTADIVERFIKKGSQLFVEGKLRTRSWEKDGEKRYVTEVIADNIQLLGKKEDSAPTASAAPQKFDPHSVKSTPIVDDLPPDDDALPF